MPHPEPGFRQKMAAGSKSLKREKTMKVKIAAALFALTLLIPVTACLAEETQTLSTPRNIAKVNNSVITDVELNRELSIIRKRYEEKGTAISDEQLKEIRNKVLDGLVRRELIYGACQKDGIKVSPEEIDEAFQMVKARYSDDASFAKMMEQFNVTEDIIKKDIAREIAIKKLIDERFVKNISVTDEEAKEYYEKNKGNFHRPESIRASHILIKVDENASNEEKAKAKERILGIKKKLENGGEFAELAKEFSEGPSAANAGDLGYFRRGQMVKPFEGAAFSMQPGQVSDVVETRFGYHLIKVIDKTAESTASFDDLKDRITVFLKQEKVQNQLNGYVEKLRKESDIQIF
jgi:peptidyl-prolyl cis-trans isomerase C